MFFQHFPIPLVLHLINRGKNLFLKNRLFPQTAALRMENRSNVLPTTLFLKVEQHTSILSHPLHILSGRPDALRGLIPSFNSCHYSLYTRFCAKTLMKVLSRNSFLDYSFASLYICLDG
jgi:hypothetical protein